MIKELLDTYEKNCKIMTSFVQPEPMRKIVSDIVTAHVGLAREVVPAMNKYTEGVINATAKSLQ
jgi:hypothetical protein